MNLTTVDLFSRVRKLYGVLVKVNSMIIISCEISTAHSGLL